ncbi:molybdate ABC transporter substrate-binding protein [Antrihabitans cavernicola]|uniref:Molybdate ABC transporter substrate-binding protein n=1 Tax=Antrihabitans cavernicola TaxID=2495913 RepID=A0A5A7SBG4_9NOCA|nr:molybdate ABC transporter substrate-binding protein [Spelaeibacter cavernicola]KAA0022187.1 molybdate ABC transporter substrate-binding protein [Spelaeibacter cavernicola]
MKLSIVAAFVGVASLLLASGCSSSDDSAAATSSAVAPSSAAAASGNITVFAAASLKATFTDIGKEFEAENPGSTVAFSFAGSSDLVAQLTQGAPADVFASADTANMKKATDASLVVGSPIDFATNTLTIVVPPGNPKGIKTFADLARPDEQVVVCAPQVPCGSATKKVEDATGTQLKPVSEESSVTDVLNKVTTGQADAGLVYVTDAAGAGDKVTSVPFPESSGAVNTYPIATLKDSAHGEVAKKFVDLVTGEKGKAILAKAGFAAP